MTTPSRSVRRSAEPVNVVEHGIVDYAEALALQRASANARAEGAGPDTLILLEHPPVYTAGRRTTDDERPTDGTPVVDVDRGGKITWHGPGQLVGYPIVALADPVDVVDFVRRLEQALIEVCDGFDLPTGRVPARSGVWLAAGAGRPARKIAAIGVRVQRGVTLHGFALNCDPDLGAFEAIVPCGIPDAGVTSLSTELGRRVRTADVRTDVARAVLGALEGTRPVTARDLPSTPVVPPSGLALHLRGLAARLSPGVRPAGVRRVRLTGTMGP